MLRCLCVDQRRNLALAVAVSLSAFFAVPEQLHAQESSLCGPAPSLPTSLQNDESIKGQLQGQADFLSKLVGKAELSGQVEAARKQLYQSSDRFFAAQKDAYLSYLFCVIVVSDKSLSTAQKLDALNKFKEPIPGKSSSMEEPVKTTDRGTIGNFSVSFSFPRFAGRMRNEIEIELRPLNHEESPISVEKIGVIELLGNDKQPYVKLDEYYDPNIVEAITGAVNNSTPKDSRWSQGVYIGKSLTFITYTNPSNMKVNGKEANVPLEIKPNLPITLSVTFPVDEIAKENQTFNFFAICPAIKLFDTRGQESVAVCPGSIEMTFSTQEYSADDYRVARLIATHLKHLGTGAPSPTTGNMYRVVAQRAGRFQLTPQMASNSCPLVAPD